MLLLSLYAYIHQEDQCFGVFGMSATCMAERSARPGERLRDDGLGTAMMAESIHAAINSQWSTRDHLLDPDFYLVYEAEFTLQNQIILICLFSKGLFLGPRGLKNRPRRPQGSPRYKFAHGRVPL